MYAADYGVFPEQTQRWEDSLQPYVKYPQSFTCPTRPKERSGFAFMSKLAGAKPDNLPQQGATDSRRLRKRSGLERGRRPSISYLPCPGTWAGTTSGTPMGMRSGSRGRGRTGSLGERRSEIAGDSYPWEPGPPGDTSENRLGDEAPTDAPSPLQT